jgi:hypothetical protein
MLRKHLPLPLNNAGNIDLPNGKLAVQYLSEGKATPNATPLYAHGKAYTFVLVGDPEAAAGTERSIRGELAYSAQTNCACSRDGTGSPSFTSTQRQMLSFGTKS